MPDLSRINNPILTKKVMTAYQAAGLIKDRMVIGTSGFTRSGDSKAVLSSFCDRVEFEPAKITLITGASLGQQTDCKLATAGAISLRLPYQSDPVMRTLINEGQVIMNGFGGCHLAKKRKPLLPAAFIRNTDKCYRIITAKPVKEVVILPM